MTKLDQMYAKYITADSSPRYKTAVTNLINQEKASFERSYGRGGVERAELDKDFFTQALFDPKNPRNVGQLIELAY